MSINLSALKQLSFLLNKKEKKQWLGIAFFASIASILELVTAFTIIAFARTLTQPQAALNFLHKIGIKQEISSTHVLIYMSILIGVIYLFKNCFVATETYYQNYAIQQMQHRTENDLLARYVKMDYSLYLTKNSSYGVSNIHDVENVFSRGVVCLANIFSEGFVFVILIGMIIYMNPHLAFTIALTCLSLYIILSKFIFPR